MYKKAMNKKKTIKITYNFPFEYSELAYIDH